MFPPVGCFRAPHCHLASGDPQLLAQLQQRIAVLETELRHAQGQRDDAQKTNLYLLETLASKSPHCEDTDTLKRQIRAADRNNAALKARLASSKQDNLRMKTKMRLALDDISARSRKMFHLELALRRTQRWHSQLETPSQGTHSTNILDLLGLNEGETKELLSTPTRALSPFGSSSGHSYDASLTNSSTPPHTLPDEHNGKASGPGVDTPTPSTADEASLHRDAQPQLESPYKYVSYFVANSKDPKHNGTCEDVGKADATQLTRPSHDDVQPDSSSMLIPGRTVAAPQLSKFSHPLGRYHVSSPALRKSLGVPKWADTSARANREFEAPPAGSYQNHPRMPADNVVGLGITIPRAVRVSEWVDDAESQNGDCGDRVFQSRGEPERAARIDESTAGFEDLQYPDVFAFGLMYQPSPLEKDVYRTVIVANVPIETTLQEVMEMVRGGLIVSTQLLNTVKITGTQTVMIVFFSETSAGAYAKFAAAHPVVFGGKTAQVTHLQKPTWPMEARLHAAITRGKNTRCLSIQDLPADMKPADLMASLQPLHSLKTDYVESLWRDTSGLVHVSLKSVMAAGMARSKLVDSARFRDCIVRFEPDPCQQPLETLLERDSISPNKCDMGLHPPAMFRFENRSGKTLRQRAVIDRKPWNFCKCTLVLGNYLDIFTSMSVGARRRRGQHIFTLG